MRKTLLAATTTAVLAVGLLAPPTALAADATHVVVGHPITAPGLRLIGDTCDGSPAPPPNVTFLERQGGTLGASALGWSVNQTASEAGPAVTIQGDPTTISTAEVDVFAPTGTSGDAYAWFPTGTNSYYVGWRSFDVPAGQWIPYDLVDVGYWWSYYENGSFVFESQTTWTIQDWAAGEGATVAEMGVLLGCGGEQFYVDRMVVANAANSATYDFEAKPTPPPPPPVCYPGHVTPECPGPVDHRHHMAHLEWSTNGKDVKTGNSVSIRYGQSLWMLGHAHLHSDVSGDSWYSGVGALTSQLSAGSSVKTELGAFGPSQYAAVKESPERTTIYLFTARAQDGFPAVTSKEVTVYVQAKVRAKVLDRHLVEGQKLAVEGQITPGTRRVKVTLQRKVGGRWTSLTASRTRAGGKFNLTTQARSPGRWKLRVKVNTTSSNVGTVTRSATVKVDRYVPPKAKPKQKPPPAPVDNTPEVTAPVDTPEPTKVTTSAPTPPDRPTPTGRTAAVAGSTKSAAGTVAPRAGMD
jgi:hypothetical protein